MFALVLTFLFVFSSILAPVTDLQADKAVGLELQRPVLDAAATVVQVAGQASDVLQAGSRALDQLQKELTEASNYTAAEPGQTAQVASALKSTMSKISETQSKSQDKLPELERVEDAVTPRKCCAIGGIFQTKSPTKPRPE